MPKYEKWVNWICIKIRHEQIRKQNVNRMNEYPSAHKWQLKGFSCYQILAATAKKGGKQHMKRVKEALTSINCL